MPKYLLQVSYTAEGTRGLLKDGGSKRREVAQAAIQSAGGTMESFYFAFGEHDVFVILDVPDTASMVATSLAINATGAVTTRTTVLISPEEVDAAVKKSPSYTGPGR